MSMKTKHKIRGGKPFEFYSELQLEECLYRLEHDTGHLKVDLRRNSDEQARFMITLTGEAEKAASVSGTLQQWGDSATRVEGMLFSGAIPNAELPTGAKPLVWFGSKLACGFILPNVILGLIWLIVATHDPIITTLVCGAVSLLIIVFGILPFLSINREFNRHGKALMAHLEDLLTDKRKKTKE
jgi:hypothetical protein